jgi:predicted transcriptional regulator
MINVYDELAIDLLTLQCNLDKMQVDKIIKFLKDEGFLDEFQMNDYYSELDIPE